MDGGNLMIVQGGGPTAVFNASLASAIAEANCRSGIRRVFGARYGVRGLVNGDTIELSRMTARELELLEKSPGAALGSSRYSPASEDFDRMISHLRRLDVRQMIFMGGNGTMHGAGLVAAHCRAAGFEVQIIGVPKTADNDIAGTDRCPGYASAARYIAQSTRDLGQDIRGLPQPVTILEVIGRSIGWPAAASVLAKADESDAPHLVYIPERAFDAEDFLSRLDGIVGRQGWAVVVVTEGLRNADGSMVYELADPSQADPLKRPMTGGVGQYLANMVGAKLRIRCRTEKPGLLCRSSGALTAKQDREDAVLVGRAGVQALAAGESEKMVSLRPLCDPGAHGYELVPFRAVTGVERPLPKEWLTDGPLPVGRAFEEYLRPLVGELFEYAPAFVPAAMGV
jgi:ATP-dependent phosphofructokinase / diphosphate-dependent phosphofructokinase